MIALLLSDHDPDGVVIAESFARSMRDDFGIKKIHPVRVALTAEQVEQFKLPKNYDAKKTSKNYKAFARRYGDSAHELEALAPRDLQRILEEAIDGVLDVDAFNHELDAELRDAAFLDGIRQRAHIALTDILREGT